MDNGDQFLDRDMLEKSAVLVDSLLRVSQIVRLRFNDWLGRFELTDGRLAVLEAMSRFGETGLSQSDLAERLGQSESNVSTLIERMSRDGLVSRCRSESDRRKRVLSLTAEGRSKLASVEVNRFLWAGRLLHEVSTDDRSTMVSVLQQLGARLESSFALRPVLAPSTLPTIVETSSAPAEEHQDPSDDPRSPQFALRKMLLALSSTVGLESVDEKDAA